MEITSLNLKKNFPIYFGGNRQFRLGILKPHQARQLFRLVDRNRKYLKEWLPWLNHSVEIKHSEDFIRNTLSEIADLKALHCGLFLKSRLIGVIGFHIFDWKKRETSLGYWIDQRYQGKGIITDACRVLIGFAVATLGLKRVVISCAVDNLRSKRIPEKLGFTVKGKVKNREHLYDHFVDHIQYLMTNKRWLSNKQGKKA